MPAPRGTPATSRPSKTSAVGPVIQTPSSRQSIPSSPPSSRTVTRRPVSPRRAVTTAAAQAPEPQASVIMPPRSQTRIRMVSRSITCTNSTLVRSGNSGSCSTRGADRRDVDRLGVRHDEDAVRVAHADRAPGAPSSGSASRSIARASGTSSQVELAAAPC